VVAVSFGRAQKVAGGRRDDPLLPGQEGDLFLALDRDDTVIDLAGQQPEREADDTGGVTAHPLDGEVRLAGVRRPKDGPHRGVGTRSHNHECGSDYAERKVPFAAPLGGF